MAAINCQEMTDSIHSHISQPEEQPVSLSDITPQQEAEVQMQSADVKPEQSVRAAHPKTRPVVEMPREARPDTTDTVAPLRGESLKGILIEYSGKDSLPRVHERHGGGDGTSWLISGLVALFLLVALRYRRNFRFAGALIQDLTSGPRRRNMFDDTVRETTFVILMNLLCLASEAVLLCGALSLAGHTRMPQAGQLMEGLGVAVGITVVYYLVQWIAYLLIGYVFTTRDGTRSWLRGFSSGRSLLGIVLFPLAMVSVFYPSGLPVLLILAGIAYFIIRVMFVFKGIRIFSRQSGAYILFLYYLCSVEIVPLVLIWKLACCFTAA